MKKYMDIIGSEEKFLVKNIFCIRNNYTEISNLNDFKIMVS